MEAMRINILNPKAVQLLKDLADLELIEIQDEPGKEFSKSLEKLRSGNQPALSLEEITAEVEAVRAARYGG